MAESVTNRGLFLLLRGAFGGTQLDLRLALLTGTAAGADDPDLNTLADLDAVTGVGLHTERLALAGETVTEDDAGDQALLDTANVSFAAAAGVTCVGVALFHEGGGTDATRDLVAVFTTGFPKPVDGGLNVNVANLIRALRP